MKNLLLLLLITVSGTAYSQNPSTFFKALKNKDTNTIHNNLSDEVDLCIGAYQDFLSQSDAISKIMEFLNNENPSGFELLHNGKSDKSGSNYKVAKLKCASGTYRVFIYYEKSNNLISEIRFDK